MKVYISLPITGHDIEEVESSCIFAKSVLKKKGHTPVSPLDVSDNPMQAMPNTWDVTFPHCWSAMRWCSSKDGKNQKAALWNTLLPKSITN